MNKRFFFLWPLVLALFFVGALTAVSWASSDEDGTITVHNDSDHEIYVVIGGYNQGKIWKGSSESYTIKYGSHKIEAQVGNESAKDWVNISPSSPTADVSFDNDDFPDVPVRKR